VDRPAPESARYASSPWAIPRAGWWRGTRHAIDVFTDTDMSVRCAGVAFFSFLSLFPAIACGVLIYGIVGDRSQLQEKVDAVSAILPPQAAAIVTGQLTSLLGQSDTELGIGLLVGLAIALWSGSRGVNSLVFALSKSHYEDQRRSFVHAALMSFGLTIGGFIVAAIALFALAVVPAAVQVLPCPRFAETIALWARWPVLALIVFAASIVLFKVAPDRADPKLRWVVPGAAVTTILWLGASILFSLYVENFASYDATFGSLAAAVILMLWIYYSTMIFVFGARLNAELELLTKRDSTTGFERPIGDRGAYVADHVR
jgi:membrane protein